MLRKLCYLTIAVICSSCSTSSSPATNLHSTGQACLKRAEAWLANPADKQKLKQALTSAKEANAEIATTKTTEPKAIIADLELLQGALNMAQMEVNDGRDPTGPSSFSEFSAANAVTNAVEQLRTDLTNRGNTPTNP
jgi:hypothetical protein